MPPIGGVDPKAAPGHERAAPPGAVEIPAIGVRSTLVDLDIDDVLVRRSDGSEVSFVVDRIEQWPKDRFPTDAVYRTADGAELRVITCAGDFDPATRSYLDNLIVFAKLAD